MWLDYRPKIDQFRNIVVFVFLEIPKSPYTKSSRLVAASETPGCCNVASRNPRGCRARGVATDRLGWTWDVIPLSREVVSEIIAHR